MSTEELKAEVLPDDYNQYDLSFKMLVIGDSGVGKSCLISKVVKGVFNDLYHETVGLKFLAFNVRINGKVIKLQIIDVSGKELYRSLISNFYRNVSLAMMVYAINSKESFSHIETWLKEVKLQSYPDIKIFLIGNKADLEEDRQVTSEEAKQFKDESGIHFFSEASSKIGLDAEEVFVKAAILLYSEYLESIQKLKEKVKNKGDRKRGFNDKLYKNFLTLSKWMNI